VDRTCGRRALAALQPLVAVPFVPAGRLRAGEQR
jgi:hypothetical protein